MAWTTEKFDGFPDGGIDFFRALALKQDREWFRAHKDDFVRLWETPMQAFLSELQRGLNSTFPFTKRAKPKVFRIYRDTRFSKDKTPFKTSISGMVPLVPGGPMIAAGVYFELGPQSFGAAGRWMMEPAVLKRFRRAVADDATGAPFAKAVEKVTKRGFKVISHQLLARVPPGFPKDSPRAELLRQKGFALEFTMPSAKVQGSKDFAKWAVAQVKAIAPLIDWVEQVAKGRRPSLR